METRWNLKTGEEESLKSNRVTATDDKITAVLVQLRRGVTGIMCKRR